MSFFLLLKSSIYLFHIAAEWQRVGVVISTWHAAVWETRVTQEVKGGVFNKPIRKAGVGTQSVDVSHSFISRVGNGPWLLPTTQACTRRMVGG